MDTREGIVRLLAAAEKLIAEVERLQRDVAILNGRMKSADSEGAEIYPSVAKPKKSWSFGEAINLIEKARTGIQNCEYELSAIRSRMDDVSRNEASREEFMKHLRQLP